MRVSTFSLSVVVTALATAGVICFSFPELAIGPRATAAQPPEQAGGAAGGMPRAMPVPVTVLKAQSVPVYLEYVGATAAVREVTLQAKVSGSVSEVAAADGSDVRAGDLLFKLDPRDYQAALDQAKAKLQGDQAALEYARFTQQRNAVLADKGIVAKDTNDQKTSLMHQAQANIAADQAAIRTAELNLSYTEIRAPFDGRLGKAQMHEGAIVTAQQTNLNTLVQLSPIYVSFNPSEADLALIEQYRRGSDLSVEIVLPSETGARYSGKLTFLDNEVDRNTGTIVARATIDNPNEELRPGQYVRVRLHLTDRPDALLVPQVALVSSQMGQYVYVVGEKGIAEQRLIETGASMGDQVVVNKGLKPGDKVITGNLQKIGPGAPVQPLPAQSAS